jgi:hypothetical protein
MRARIGVTRNVVSVEQRNAVVKAKVDQILTNVGITTVQKSCSNKPEEAGMWFFRCA